MSISASRPVLTLIAAVICGLSLSPAISAEGTKQPQVSISPEVTARLALRMEVRIRRLHDRLAIAPAQDALWAPIAQAMRDNEGALSTTLAAS